MNWEYPDEQCFCDIELEDGTELVAWFNPRSYHWLDEGRNRQIGADCFINNQKIEKVRKI